MEMFHAAVGQCSNLQGNNNGNRANEVGRTHISQSSNQSKYRKYAENNVPSHSRRQLREGRDDGSRHSDGDVVMSDGASMANREERMNIAKYGQKIDKFQIDESGRNKNRNGMQPPHHDGPSGASRHGRRSKVHVCPTEDFAPPPPEGSVRTRCYRLNLDAPVVLSPTHDHLGPFPYEPPLHHQPSRSSNRRKSESWRSATDAMKTLQVSHSGDTSAESNGKSTTQIAISTARIFRGITTDKNGVILSQNARASRSKTNKDRSKQADKSRQGNKIEKAIDIVDEVIHGPGKENTGEKSNMLSLVVIGEYDDMKQLVRDGAKKLRDQDGQPDENLLALNRSRQMSQQVHGRKSLNDRSSPLNTSSRKRLPSPSTSQTAVENRGRSRSRNRMVMPPNTPPKLKGHPRDRPSTRRLSNGTEGNEEKSRCNDMSLFGGGDSDWSEALDFSKGFHSIWNCGGTGTTYNTSATSPTNISTPSKTSSKSITGKTRYEGRNESNTRYSRGSGTPTERESPGGNSVILS